MKYIIDLYQSHPAIGTAAIAIFFIVCFVAADMMARRAKRKDEEFPPWSGSDYHGE